MKSPICRSGALLLISLVYTGTGFGKVLATAEFKGHQYHLLDQKSWAEQDQEAKSHGWYLAAIGDKEENDFIRSTFAGPRGNVWIGLTDSKSEGQFGWTNGEAVTYTFWAPNEPNNDQGHGNFVHMYETGHWNDELNDRKFFAVAEQDPNAKPPSSISSYWPWLLAVPIAVAVAVVLARRRTSR
jgi:hypothetical protein